jgi:type II secretory pathway component GspD/PulD (secretin)
MMGAAIPGPVAGIGFSLGPFNNLFFDAQVTAAEQSGDLSILSRPSIVASNNMPATIHSGVKYYVRTAASLTLSSGSTSGSASTGSSGSSGTSGSGASGSAGGAAGGASADQTAGLQEIDSGITLVVTPQITGDNKINLTINVTDSQADFTNEVDGIPSIVDNIATTTVLLDNGAITVIGGLSQKNVQNTKSGIPFLQNIPIFGYLFGSNQKTDIKKELLIFLKPTLVADGDKPAIQDKSEKRYEEVKQRAEPERKPKAKT